MKKKFENKKIKINCNDSFLKKNIYNYMSGITISNI